MQLKEYQRQCLSQLQEFAKAVVQHSDAGVAYYQQTRSAYQEVPQLPQLPYVCLRVPTGGGKTILGACAVGLLTTEYLRASHSLVLWLAPSDTIVQQTLQALRDRNHPYRLALEQGLQGAPLEVMDLSQALYLTRGALDGATTVIVSTIQALRVDDTSGRKVYENNGSLMSHFSGLSQSVQENLEKDSAGNLAFSLANVLRLRRPLVIMDEAHNARTPLSFETLTRFAPSFVLELTATPSLVHAPSKGLFASNVLVSISALALKQANMIKMPIQLEVYQQFEDVLRKAVDKQTELERLAKQEADYIRPIVLLTAQSKQKDEDRLTPERLKQLLTEDYLVPEAWIAIATGNQDDLTGLDIGASDCPIRFIITVQKLREGWDCPFAYVLANVANTQSSTAMEQIIGRIMRLPKATLKQQQPLNQAYVYSTLEYSVAEQGVLESLTKNGFNKLEARIALENPQLPLLNLPNGGLWDSSQTVLQLESGIDLAKLPASLVAKLITGNTPKQLGFIGRMSAVERDTLCGAVSSPADAAQITEVYQTIKIAPALEGVAFRVPQLVVQRGAQTRLFSAMPALSQLWRLSGCDCRLSESQFPTSRGDGRGSTIDVSATGLQTESFIAVLHNQQAFLDPSRGWTLPELVRWLDRRIIHTDIAPADSIAFTKAALEHLIASRGQSLDWLGAEKFRLRDALEKIIEEHRHTESQRTFDGLFAEASLSLEPSFVFSFQSDQNYYASTYYDGTEKFKKHYYSRIGDLKSTGQEVECAKLIDRSNHVAHWVRNVPRTENSFALPGRSQAYYYPDFVVQLTDGRVVVIEFKGTHLSSGDKAQELRDIGQRWEAKSQGKALFLMPTQTTLHSALGSVGII